MGLQATAADSFLARVQELVGRVQEHAKYSRLDSPWPTIHQSLAAAVSALTIRLASKPSLTEILGTPAGRQLTRDLQRIYCQGSVLERYCSAEAIAHQPSCAVGFFLGYGKLTQDMPELGITADCVPLERAAAFIDRALTEATQVEVAIAGVNKLTALCTLRQWYIWAVSNTMTTPEAVARWGLNPASPALEPLLHLALGEVLGGCEMAAEQLGGAAGPAQRTMLAEQQEQENLLGVGQSRGNRGFQVVVALLPLARTAAMQHRFDLQRLMDAAPGFTKAVPLVAALDLYSKRAGQLVGLQLDVLRQAANGLTTVLTMQQAALHSLCGPRVSSTQKASLRAALDQRMQWVAAAAAFAKVLHSLADAASSGSSSREADHVYGSIDGSQVGLKAALGLVADVLAGSPEVDCVAYKDCIGSRPALAKLPGAVVPLLELAQLLLRLAPKCQALVGAGASGQAAAQAAGMMNAPGFLIVDLAEAPSLLPSSEHQAQGPGRAGTGSGGCGTSSSNTGAAPAAETLLQSVASLAGTAAKLERCMAAMGPIVPASEPLGRPGTRGRVVINLEQVALLCCQVLSLNPHLVQTPTPQRSLIRHLRSTGFLAFITLPALSQVHGALGAQERKMLTGRGQAINIAVDLLRQLVALHLMDDAVRGGGLGSLLNRYLQNLMAPRHLSNALPLLMVLCKVLGSEHAEGLAVALVRDGLLQTAAEHSARLAEGQSTQGAKGKLPLYTVMLFRAVCSVLDENASTGLLATFSTLLEGVPTFDACAGMTPEVMARRGQFVLPNGPWVARFHAKPAWEQVRSDVLPALSAACEGLASDRQQQEGIFRDVAVSAWTCCSPGCTNMAGQQEASLALSKCTGCGEARYCSKQCQRQDWRRHKPICQAIRELK